MLPERMLYRFRDLVKHKWRGVVSEEDVMNLVCTYRIVVQIYIQEGLFFYIPELENAVEKHRADIVLTALNREHIENVDFTELRKVASQDASNTQVKECFCPTAAVPESIMLRWLLAGTREFSCHILDTGKIYGYEPPCYIFKIDAGKSLDPQEIVINLDDLMVSREEIVKFEREHPEESKEQMTDIDDEKPSTTSTSVGGSIRPGENILKGWKEVAVHTDRSESWVKKRLKHAVRRDVDTGRIITTTHEIDSYILKRGIKKK
ncbi:MAG: hypothetical protein AB7E77_01795 [Desulfobulbus sp.]